MFLIIPRGGSFLMLLNPEKQRISLRSPNWPNLLDGPLNYSLVTVQRNTHSSVKDTQRSSSETDFQIAPFNINQTHTGQECWKSRLLRGLGRVQRCKVGPSERPNYCWISTGIHCMLEDCIYWEPVVQMSFTYYQTLLALFILKLIFASR